MPSSPSTPSDESKTSLPESFEIEKRLHLANSWEGETPLSLNIEKGSFTTIEYANHIAELARAGTEEEHDLDWRAAVRLYPYAFIYAMILSSFSIMEGYDLVTDDSLYAAFDRGFGKSMHQGRQVVSAEWQMLLSVLPIVAEIVGLLITGYVAERWGNRPTMFVASLILLGSLFVTFFAENIEVLLIGELLCGLPWGTFQAIGMSYATEVAPLPLRHVVTCYIGFCHILGQIVGAAVLRAVVHRTDEWAYRIVFAVQWTWLIPIFAGILLAPESPQWLIRKGRLDDARGSFNRMTCKDFDPARAERAMAMLIHTSVHEQETDDGSRYRCCFQGTNLRRTEIACVAYAMQILCGEGLLRVSAQFLQQCGISAVNAFDLTVASYALAGTGTFLSVFIMPKVPQRTLCISGLCVTFGILGIIGLLSVPQIPRFAGGWAIGGMLLVFAFTNNLSVTPVSYNVVPSISSSQLRTKTTVLASVFYQGVSILNGLITPQMVNPTGWRWRGYAGFFWGSVTLLFTVWCIFRLPEIQGKTVPEITAAFEASIPARAFGSTRGAIMEGGEIDASPTTDEERASQQTA